METVITVISVGKPDRVLCVAYADLLDYGGGGLKVMVGDGGVGVHFHQIFMKRESDMINLPCQALCCLICIGGWGVGVWFVAATDAVSDQR